jgi:hypothetical protein
MTGAEYRIPRNWNQPDQGPHQNKGLPLVPYFQWLPWSCGYAFNPWAVTGETLVLALILGQTDKPKSYSVTRCNLINGRSLLIFWLILRLNPHFRWTTRNSTHMSTLV